MTRSGSLKLILLLIFCVLLMFMSVALGVFGANGWYLLNRGDNMDLIYIDDNHGVGLANILFIGIDDHGLADTLMLVSVNGITNSINILSIPRDTRTSFGSRFGKINEVYAVGQQAVRRGDVQEPEDFVIRRIRELTGLPVHYFVTFHIEGFREVVDILGGVEIDVPNLRNGGMFYNDPTPGGARINLTAGLQTLNGSQAEGFVRFRGFDGDIGRVERQQQFVTALAEQHLTIRNIANINALFGAINDHVRTNFSARDMIRYANLARAVNTEEIQSFQVPGHGAWVGQISYFIPNLRELETLVNEHFVLRLDAEPNDIENGEPNDEGDE